MKFLISIKIVFTCSILSCSSDANKPKPLQKDEFRQPPYTKDTTKVTKEYIATGYYLLADNLDGIKMRKEQSNEVYSIAKKPFLSVDQILHCRLQLDSLGEGIHGIINIEFDEKGTQNFKDITGNPLYPYIAVAVANKLLYVVEVQAKITTGKADIILTDYSKKEMQAMVDEINKKR
jgi:preprotein translocase subunit SecD